MKTSTIIAACLLLGGLAFAADPPKRVYRVVGEPHDGDTFIVKAGNVRYTIRLAGIDAPELSQPGGKEAREELRRFLSGERLNLNGPFTTDRYGRLVCDATTFPGQSAARYMVGKGYAWWYVRYAPKDTILRDLEAKARKDKLGLWGLVPLPIEPWAWRKGIRVQPMVKPPAPTIKRAA